jgi:hypothetical protein
MTEFDGLRTGQSVSIFMGAGWQRGTMLYHHGDSVTVRLQHRTVRVFDSRNIKASVSGTG